MNEPHVTEKLASGNVSDPASGCAVPQALFSCSNEYCRPEVSYPADMLYWFDAEKRWVCEMCWDDLPAPTDDDGKLTRGITLAEYIIGHQLPAVALLHNDQAHALRPKH